MATAVEVAMKVLYVRGASADVDSATIAQLRAVAPELDVTSSQGSAEALAEARRQAGWHAILVSPALPQNETLALIASLRRDRAPVAIVPVVEEGQKDLYAAAVASGADDVLIKRGQSLVNVAETLARIQQSPHLIPANQRRRIGVLYAGKDTLVWNLLEQVPFIKAERVACGIDGSCPVRAHGSGDGTLRTDVVVIDEQPGDAHPLQVLKSVKAQASDLPVIVLTSSGSSDIATAALELGADDTVLKTGIFRRRLIATLRRVHQRIELTAQQAEMKAREERLRQIVEQLPAGVSVIGADGVVLAMNAAALEYFGATKPREVVGKDFRLLSSTEHQPALTEFIRTVTKGEASSLTFTAQTLDGRAVPLAIKGVVLERDAKGGRGVVASLSRANVVAADPAETAAQQQQVSVLQATIARLERHYTDLELARSQDQTAWDLARQQLEDRLEAATAAAKNAPSHDALRQLTEQMERERAAWKSGESQVERDLNDARAALAAERADRGAQQARAEEALREARTLLESERAAWAASRLTLETQHGEAQREIARLGLIATTPVVSPEHEARLRQTEDELAATRAKLEAESATRAAIEARLASDVERAHEATRALGEEYDATRQRLEQERNEARQHLGAMAAELAQLRAAHEQAGDATKHAAALEPKIAALETELGTLRAALTDRDRVVAELTLARDAANRGLADAHLALARTATDAKASVTAELGAQIAALTAQLGEARQQISERDHLHNELTGARDEVTRAESTLTAERQAWDASRRALEAALADKESALAADRRAWEREREGLLQQRTEDPAMRDAHDRLQVGLDALRTDYASVLQSLTSERADREREQQELADLRTKLADAVRDRSQLSRELDATSAEAESLLRRRDLDHTERVRALESKLAEAADQLAQLRTHTERGGTPLVSATEGDSAHTRLITSDLFGYALTTADGHLVRCNHAFARMFGYTDAADAMSKTAGGAFPSFAGRTDLTSRLATQGRVDHIESCLQRQDGQPVRVLETATWLPQRTDRGTPEPMVEHVVLASDVDTSADATQSRRLSDVGALAAAMLPEIEEVATKLQQRPEDANQLAGRLSALVRQLGAYSRRQAKASGPASLSDVVQRAEPVLVRLAGDYISFRTDVKPTAPISAQAADLDQLVTSLITLGRDILPAGGSIVVDVKPQEGAMADGVSLSVTASGYGLRMPERPFAVEQVAERCGGLLSITGEPGWLAKLDVTFSRCGVRERSTWRWATDAD